MGERTEEIEQIAWFEDRDGQKVAFLTERPRGGAWEFWERRVAEVQYQPIPSTQDLVREVMHLRQPNRH